MHVTRYRLLHRDEASTIWYAQDTVFEYLDALEEVYGAAAPVDVNPKRRFPRVSVGLPEEAKQAMRAGPSADAPDH